MVTREANDRGNDLLQDDDTTRVIAGSAALTAADDPDKTIIKPLQRQPKPQPQPLPQPPSGQPLRARPLASPFPKRAGSLALRSGFQLHEYRIDKVLGQGGFGITYLATDINLNSRVAIKEFLPEEIAFRKNGQTVSAHSSKHRDRYKRGLDSFLIEGRTLASFRHPNIVRVARFFEAHQTAYMVLEYELGSSLKSWWSEHADMSEKDLARLLQPLLDGLAVVHATGFLHRDIKPDNIQVRSDDGSLVLLDFGSARQAVGSSSEQSDVVVTPGYAPVEQYGEGAEGEQGAWTDIYALGATLYWMLSGRKPIDAMERAAALARGADPLPSISQQVAAGRFSPDFLNAIDWALKLDRHQRPASVEQWRRLLFAGQAAHLGLQEALRAGDLIGGMQAALPTQLGTQIGRRLRLGWRTLKAPSAWSLTFKLSLAMLLSALLPMAITGYYNLQSSLASVTETELRHLELLAVSTAGRMAQLVGDSRKLARILGSDREFIDFLTNSPGQQNRDKAAMLVKMKALVTANTDVHLMMLMNSDGTAVVCNDAKTMGSNFAFREYFKEAMQGRPHSTGIIVGSVSGTAGMVFAYPVLAADGRVVGVIALRIRGEAFDAILAEVRRDLSVTPFLIDDDGVLIGHPDRAALYSSLGPLSAATAAQLRADQRFRRDNITNLDMPELAAAMVRAAKPSHISYHSTLSNDEQIVGYAPVLSGGNSSALEHGNNNHWVVGISESRASFEQPLNSLFYGLLSSMAVVGLCFAGLALWFARRIVRPIQALTRAADALKAGDFGRASIKVESQDEVGQLTRTFNVLIDVLRQRESERGSSKG